MYDTVFKYVGVINKNESQDSESKESSPLFFLTEDGAKTDDGGVDLYIAFLNLGVRGYSILWSEKKVRAKQGESTFLSVK